ncbi:uncharacterized protein LOC121521216 isoform X2 [Cheilinus undulatus]|uniref:uncharacterized protein LOC121521216 isoform X2 n=1 Tax=Cheilinus undulatus TaxID=241271 RepID=UPI001BD5C4ED|nr:uncharacterized protein LOC121521216 isoform X2 [Cheilinus undulatus]
MKSAAFIIGLLFSICECLVKTPGAHLEEPRVQYECRDRYLWIHVTSTQTPPRFEAVDGHGVHSISEQHASLCGYTISTSNTDASTTLRASFYACFTHTQDDQVFTFRLNVVLSDSAGRWISSPVSAVCSGVQWTHREVTCEDDYMEINVDRESSCGGPLGNSGQVWQTALSQAQSTARSDWQLMVLKSDGQVISMSINEAGGRGLSLTTTGQRIVLRSRYKQAHSELTTMNGVPVEVVRVSVFSKQKLTLVMIDVSMACTRSSGSFDGSQLLWDIPLVMSPLIGEGVGFESRNLGVGVEGVLLDKTTAATRGIAVVKEGPLVQIRVPFGAEGGYRKSVVLDNVYKEKYVISVLYEHVFSLLFEDGSSIDTKHRTFQVLDTPLLCRSPFSLDQTMNDDQVFRLYLGNIPTNVVLQEVLVNGKKLMAESAKQGFSISSAVHANGSRAYELQLPFEDPAVYHTYLGDGMLQYSADLNLTLTITPHGDSYYHHTVLTARVFNAFPPEITAQCSDGGITFSVLRPPRAESVWEVGVDHEPLTSELAAQRGYRLYGDNYRTTLEVPVFSIGYTYEGISLSNFYATFKLLLRDSKTLAVQTSTSKRCLFKTQDMIVCSADGTMTVVTTPTSTWPKVRPERTTLLDPACGPKQTDEARVLFEFKLETCGTRAMAGESYVLYENEIIHDRQLIADGPNVISRESQFKLTVRCFYPLSGVSRLSVDRNFRAQTPGLGSVKVYRSLKDSENGLPVQDCSGSVADTLRNQVHQNPVAGSVYSHYSTRPKPGPDHLITEPVGHNIKLLHSSQNAQNFANLHLPPLHKGPNIGTHEVHLQASQAGSLLSLTQERPVSRTPTSGQPGNLLGNRVQLSHPDTLNFSQGRWGHPGLSEDSPVSDLGSSSRIPDSLDGGQSRGNCGSSKSSPGERVWPSALAWDQPTGNGLIHENANFAPAPDIQDLTQHNVVNLDLGLHRYSGLRPQRLPSQTTLLHQVLEPLSQSSLKYPGSSDILQPSKNKKYVPAYSKPSTSKPYTLDYARGQSVDSAVSPLSASHLNQKPQRPGSLERQNPEAGQSGVKKVRVKPLSKLISAGQTLDQTAAIQPGHSQIPHRSQYGAGLNAERRDGNQWTSQNRPYLRGSNIRTERVPEGAQIQMLKQVQGSHQVLVKLDQSAADDWFQKQQGQQQEPIQPLNDQQDTQQSTSQPTGVSHIRVRLVSGLQERFQNQNNQEPKQLNIQNPTPQSDTRGGTRWASSNTHASTRENQSNTPSGSVEMDPAAGRTGSVLNGSAGSGSQLKVEGRSDCGQYGASVHNGIMRGKQIS